MPIVYRSFNLLKPVAGGAMAEVLRSADFMKQALLADLDQLKTDPATAVTKAADEAKGAVPAFRNDPWVYRLVVMFLGVALLAVIICYAVAPIYKATLPDGLIAIGAAAVGALAGLLAPAPGNR